jgi:hypothetical protein
MKMAARWQFVLEKEPACRSIAFMRIKGSTFAMNASEGKDKS